MKKKTKQNPLELFMHGVFLTCGFIAIGFVIVITVYLISAGLPAIQ